MRHTLWTGMSETNVNVITSATRTHAFNNNNLTIIRIDSLYRIAKSTSRSATKCNAPKRSVEMNAVRCTIVYELRLTSFATLHYPDKPRMMPWGQRSGSRRRPASSLIASNVAPNQWWLRWRGGDSATLVYYLWRCSCIHNDIGRWPDISRLEDGATRSCVKTHEGWSTKADRESILDGNKTAVNK